MFSNAGLLSRQSRTGPFTVHLTNKHDSHKLFFPLDTIYTERYMGLPTPEDNLRGYSRAALSDKIANLRNKKYFLIHGTLDDNVHYQQSLLLSKELEKQDILFRQQVNSNQIS